jgi:hypothetical protein
MLVVQSHDFLLRHWLKQAISDRVKRERTRPIRCRGGREFLALSHDCVSHRFATRLFAIRAGTQGRYLWDSLGQVEA